MGKEVKIGLAFILSLLIVFGVVLGRRLMAPSQEQASASAEKANDKTAGKGRRGAAEQDTESKFPAPDGPTVVTAKTVSGKSPKGSAAQWNVVSDEAGSGRSGGGAAEAPLPSYMPKPTPSSAHYYERYGSSAQESTSAKPWRQDGADTAPSVETAPISDPFNGRETQTPNAAEPLDPPTGELKVLSPPTQAPAAADGGYGQNASPGSGRGPGSFAARQGSSYHHAEPSRPPEPVAEYSPVGQYSAPIRRSGSIYETGGGAQLAGSGLRGNDGSYKVQPNDNYWVISRRLYGTGAYFKALAEHNRNKVPQEDQLTVGQSIFAPSVTELEELYPELCPKPSRREIVKQRATSAGRLSSYRGGRTYTVQQGDTLFDIARYELGKASRWSEIYELNRDVIGEDYDYLPTGLELALPSDAPAENVTRHPGSDQYYR